MSDFRKYTDREIDHLWDKIKIIFRESRRALKEAKRLMNIRLGGMNEVRDQLERQAATFVTKDELRLTTQKLDNLQKMVWIGLGIWAVFQLILIFIFKKVL